MRDNFKLIVTLSADSNEDSEKLRRGLEISLQNEFGRDQIGEIMYDCGVDSDVLLESVRLTDAL